MTAATRRSSARWTARASGANAAFTVGAHPHGVLARCRSLILAMNAFKTPQRIPDDDAASPRRTRSASSTTSRAPGRRGSRSGFVNSLIYGVVASVGAVILASLAAYGIVRLKIPRGLFWFLLIYSGTIFPFQMYLIPLFNMYLDTGLYDTRLGMIAFYIAICIPFCTFVMRGFFLTVPWEIQEAAAHRRRRARGRSSGRS